MKWDWPGAITNFMAVTGLSEEAFWSMTPRQTHRSIKAAEARADVEQQNRHWHTWHIAALPLFKKFPTLADFMPAGPEQSRPRQTEEEQIAVVRQWAAISRAMSQS